MPKFLPIESFTNFRDMTDSIMISKAKVSASLSSRTMALGTLNVYNFDQYVRTLEAGKLRPYVLLKDHVNILPEKRLKSYSISDVVYDWARLQRPTKKPTDLPTLMIDNHSRSRQTITRTLTQEEEGTQSIVMTSAKGSHSLTRLT